MAWVEMVGFWDQSAPNEDTGVSGGDSLLRGQGSLHRWRALAGSTWSKSTLHAPPSLSTVTPQYGTGRDKRGAPWGPLSIPCSPTSSHFLLQRAHKNNTSPRVALLLLFIV